MTLDLARLVRDVTARKLADPDYWRLHGIPMPAKYLTQDITIPESIRKPAYAAERAAAHEYGDEP